MATENPAVESMDLAADVELSIKERLFYTSGVIGMIVPFMLPLAFLNFFWLNVLHIPAGIVGTFLMVCKLFDAANDPIESMIIDRTRAKGGRYRPWLVPSGLTCSVITLLLFVKLPDTVSQTTT